jgi:hypothetical protein
LDDFINCDEDTNRNQRNQLHQYVYIKQITNCVFIKNKINNSFVRKYNGGEQMIKNVIMYSVCSYYFTKKNGSLLKMHSEESV